MNPRQTLVTLLAAAGLAAGGWGLYALGMQRGMQGGHGPTAPASAPAAAGAPGAVPQGIPEGEAATRRHIAAGIKAGDTDPVVGRQVLYYQDPMVPGQRFDRPAKSPFMDMMLVPVYAGADSDPGGVSVSPQLQQNLGLRTAPVTQGTVMPELVATGSIAFNERDQAVVQARAAGYVERLHVRATLDRVARGQLLAELYVPDWVAAQEEFLAVRRMQGADLGPLVEGARQRMQLAGMSEAQIERVERSGRTDARIAIHAPIAGLVTELALREGMSVAPGATLFRINGFSSVWAQAEVPESQAALVRAGARVQAETPAVPGASFTGKVQALVPELNAATRTLKARVELANPRGLLVPGMFVTMRFGGLDARPVLQVPSEALIHTGRRTVVIVAEEGGRFRSVEVQAGQEAGGQTEIRSGLQAGQQVVVSGQFLVDSEASLKGVEARLNAAPAAAGTPLAGAASAPAAAAPAGAATHRAEGVVEALGKGEITLSHGPIPALKWPAMTMDFKAPPAGAAPPRLAPGDRIVFEFNTPAEGLPQLTRITPANAAPATAPAPAPAAAASGAAAQRPATAGSRP